MKTCKFCQESFTPPARHPKQMFCSIPCRTKGQIKSKEVPCEICGTICVRKVSRLKRTAHSYCSKVCEAEGRRMFAPRGENHVQYKQRIPVLCTECNATIYRVPSLVKSRNFCNPTCRTKWQASSGYNSGANNHAWKGGCSEYRGKNWRKQRNAARERDNNTCQRCGCTNRQLQVHHIQPFDEFESYEQANVLENLRTLCLVCHKTEEWEYWKSSTAFLSSPDKRRPLPVALRSNRDEPATS